MTKQIVTRCFVALLVVVLGAGVAHAKQSQPPDQGPSYDFASEIKGTWLVAMADDWTCSDGLPIAGIRWWGSYWTTPVPGGYTIYSDGLNGAANGGIDSFLIYVYANELAGGDMTFDHPDVGLELAGWRVPVNETKVFTVQKPTNPAASEDVYRYEADLTTATPLGGYQGGPFAQESGQKYWLVIQAEWSEQDNTRQWGWHEADGHWGSYAVQLVRGTGSTGWYIPCCGHDMAFELIPVPEPSSVAALAFGLVGLAPFAGRIRRRGG